MHHSGRILKSEALSFLSNMLMKSIIEYTSVPATAQEKITQPSTSDTLTGQHKPNVKYTVFVCV